MSGKRGRIGHPSSLNLEHDRVMLSTQEFNVVRLTQNNSYATVADELEISESTVGMYRSRATNKINRQAILTRSDEDLAELIGVSERSASRLKKVLRDYGESQ